MAEGERRIELKFRIYDGTDVGHSTYESSMTVGTLKQRLVAEWPQDKTIRPELVDNVRIIYSGKVLKDNDTLAESIRRVGDLPGGAITMHVVLQSSEAREVADKKGKRGSPCGCTIL